MPAEYHVDGRRLNGVCSIRDMQITTGAVIGGEVTVDENRSQSSTVVTILARQASESFEMPPELEAGLSVCWMDV